MDGTGNQTELETMLGGSGAPGNEAPASGGQEVPPASATGREGSGGGQPAETGAPAWTSQLSKELRENAQAFGKVSGFKTISELADAFVKAGANGQIDLAAIKPEDFNAVMEKLGAPKEGESYGFEKDLPPEFEKYAREARLTKGQAAKALEGYQAFFKGAVERQVAANIEKAKATGKEISEALLTEFGQQAADYYRKAVRQNGLDKKIARSEFAGNKDIARALCLLGREMSEDHTPGGSGGGESKPARMTEGRTLSF